MLFELLRRHMKNILIVTVIIITPAFVMWGTGTGAGQSMSSAVALRIDGTDVSPRKFAQAVDRATRYFGQENAVSNAIDTLLDDYVIQEASDELGIEITNADIQARLKLNPSFRNADGSFNAERWNRTLRSKSANWATALAAARYDLQREKVLGLVQSTVQIPPTEVRAQYEHDQARRRVAYAEFAANQFTEEVTVDESDLRTYYDAQQERYREPTKVRLVIVQWKKEPSELDAAEVQALLGDLTNRLETGADFADLARQYSQGDSAPQGGDLGYFTKGKMIPAFSDMAFSLTVGEISPPVLTKFGWHIIKLEDRRESDGQTEVRARHILLSAEPSVDTLTELHEAATRFADTLRDRPLGPTAEAAGLGVTRTEPLAQIASTIPEVGQAREILTATFSLEPGVRTDIVDTSEAFVLAEVLERIESHVPALDQIRARVEEDLRLVDAGTIAEQRAQAAVAAARSVGDLAAVEADVTGPVTETALFTRVGFIPDVGRPAAFMEAAFALDPGDVSEPLPHGERWFVVQVREAAPADPADFETESATIRERLELGRRRQAVEDFLLKRKATLEVEQNAEYLAQLSGGF